MAILKSGKADCRANSTRARSGALNNDKRFNTPRRHSEPNSIPQSRASKYMKQNPLEVKGEIDKSTIIVGNFNNHACSN